MAAEQGDGGESVIQTGGQVHMQLRVPVQLQEHCKDMGKQGPAGGRCSHDHVATITRVLTQDS
jgi:hypothetical protein